MDNGEQVCVAVFQQLIQKMAMQALEEYEEVMEEDDRDKIVACIRENRFMDIDKLDFFYPMLRSDRYDYFAEPDAKDKLGQMPNCVDAYVIQYLREFLGLDKKDQEKHVACLLGKLTKNNDSPKVAVQEFFERALGYPVLVQIFSNLVFEGSQYKDVYFIFDKNVRKFVNRDMPEEKFKDTLKKLPTLITGKALQIVYEQTKDRSSDGKLFMEIMTFLDKDAKIDHERTAALCKEKVEKNVSYGKFIQLIDTLRKISII